MDSADRLVKLLRFLLDFCHDLIMELSNYDSYSIQDVEEIKVNLQVYALAILIANYKLITGLKVFTLHFHLKYNSGHI